MPEGLRGARASCVESLQFQDPVLLWFLLAPAILVPFWVRQLVVRRREIQRLTRTRQLPVRVRYSRLGDGPFWLASILAVSLLVMALARPSVVTSVVRRSGIDVVVLLDGSASMHVNDVEGNRWQRSMKFLRVLGDSMSWDSDRIALMLFAHIATPQVRLTSDPNTFFFFLEHLARAPPFRLENDTSWDTNIALGIEWGLRVLDKDEEFRGPSSNPKLFLVVSDGQAWSGTVDDSLQLVRARRIPIVVVGVGTSQGGVIPDPKRQSDSLVPIVRSRLDRESLARIADSTAGRYFELDRDRDETIAFRIVEAARRRAVSSSEEPTLRPLYWECLAAAGGVLLAGLLVLREPTALALHVVAGAATLMALGWLLG